MSTANLPLLSPQLLAQLERLELVTRKIFRGRMKGERRSKRKGQSVEFADFRNYVPGDDLRFIDWNTYARLDKLFLKLFLEEEDLHFYALIDASASMDFGSPTKLEYAKQLAAALGFIGLKRADRVKVETLGQSAGSPGRMWRGRKSLWPMLDYLDHLQPGENVPLADGVKNFCLRNSGKGILVLLSDLMDKQGYETALRYLLSQQMDVYVIQILSAEELDPDLKGDLRLVDCEDADVAEITTSAPLLKRYKATLAAFVEGAREYCSRRGMNYLLANSQVPVDQLVSNYFAQTGARALISLMNMLDWWQWAILGAVPPAIVLLYFLKLKRLPLEVPSTYLWHKSIEDLRVNSIWQRLRQSLLLLLQLLLVALAVLALLRPGWMGSKSSGGRKIFLVDNSASMSADDVKPTRLGEAKRRVGELIDEMASGDVAMLVSFSDSARVEQLFTDNRRELRRRLEAIAQTNRSTSLGEALRVAAGLANPGREFETSNNQVAEGMPATLYIFSDGKFPDVEGFSLGNLTPIFVPIGKADADNVGITAFSTRRTEGKDDQLQAFARLENCGDAPVKAEVELTLDGSLIDADKVDLKGHGSGAVVFNVSDIHTGILVLRLRSGGALKADDQAWAAVNRPRHSKVLLVTPGDEALRLALTTERATELADVSLVKPEVLETKEYRQQAAGGAYDFIIYDQCRPHEMPESNTLFIGRLPPVGWSALDKVAGPQVFDTNASHPITQLIDLTDVRFAEAVPLKPPTGSTSLIEADAGVLFAVAPREGFEDAVLGVEIVGVDEKGERYANTDWPLRLSFPVFILNLLDYFGGNRESATATSVSPGRMVALSSTASADNVTVKTPSGALVKVNRGKSSTINFTETDELGVYEVLEGKQTTQRFAVNLFDSFETDIRPRPKNSIWIGYSEVQGQSHWTGARRETWKLLLLLALGVLLLEWYIYNRRVYV